MVFLVLCDKQFQNYKNFYKISFLIQLTENEVIIMLRKFLSKKRNKIIIVTISLIILIIGSTFFTIFIILPMTITPFLNYFPLGIGTNWIYNSTNDDTNWTTRRYISDSWEFIGIDFTVHYNEEHDGVWQNRMWLGKNINSLVWWGFEDTNSKYIASFGLTYVVEPVSLNQANGGTTIGLLTINNQISLANFAGSYTIEAIEEVTVPAGTFQNCIKVHEIENTPGGIADFYVWYAPNVGPLKFDYPNRNNRTDMLYSYSITTDEPFETWLLPKVPRMIITTLVVMPIIAIILYLAMKKRRKKKLGSH